MAAGIFAPATGSTSSSSPFAIIEAIALRSFRSSFTASHSSTCARGMMMMVMLMMMTMMVNES